MSISEQPSQPLPVDKTFEKIPTTHALEHYKNHCEFSGYSVEETDEFSIFCRHSRKDFFTLILLGQNVGVLAQIMYVTPERFQDNLIPLYVYANELNSLFSFMKIYIHKYENELPIMILNSVLEGEYSRKNFAIFLDNIDCDMRKFHSYTKTHDMWRTESECNS